MLIDKSYFIGEILIPNLSSIGSGGSQAISKANDDLLQVFIRKYEKLFLLSLLGPSLYEGLKKGFEAKEEKWMALAEQLADSENHISPIANYVYYWFIRNKITETAGIGEVIGKANNAVMVSPEIKMVRAWNEMVDLVNEIVRWIDERKTMYPAVCPDFKADIFYKINMFNL